MKVVGFLFLSTFSSLNFLGIWDAEGGGGKTGAESAALHGFEINTAFDVYNYLKQHHFTTDKLIS